MLLATHFAVYFIVWWICLFLVLPVGMRSQQDEGEVVLGTVASAPARFRFLKVMGINTLISAAVYGLWLFVSDYLGYGLDALPTIMPNFG